MTIRRIFILLFALVAIHQLAACGTRLSAVSARDEQAGMTIAAAGYHAHVDGGPDQLRYSSLWCKGREVLVQGGVAVSDAGMPPCQ